MLGSKEMLFVFLSDRYFRDDCQKLLFSLHFAIKKCLFSSKVVHLTSEGVCKLRYFQFNSY